MLIVDFVRLQTVVGDPCDPGNTDSNQLLGGRPRDVVDWLTNHEFVSATNLHSTDVAGKTGFSVDINLKADPGRSCAGSAEENLSSVGLYETTEIHRAGGSSFGGVYKIRVGEQNRWIILDVGGDAPLLFNLQCRIAECADYFPWAQELVDTVAITEDN